MFKLPDKQPVFAKLEPWQINQIQPNEEGFLGLFQRDTIADQIEADIDAYSLQMYFEDKPRHHIGASVIGHECARYVWGSFRWLYKYIPKPRMPRLWYRGHREEDVIIEQLRGIGCQILAITDDGEQLKIERDSGDGHFGGSLDALVKFPIRYCLPDQWHLLEMKTIGSKYFKDMKNLGVYKAREIYYAQMCVYAKKLTEIGTYGPINYALFYGVNKDTDDNDIEVIELDHTIGQMNISKAEDIIQQYYPPAKLSQDASFYKCKWCPMYEVCQQGKEPEHNCRSCRFAQPIANGQWHCHNWNAVIPKEALINGCEKWESLPL